MKISEIKLNPDNPREISADKFEKLKKSIKGFEKMLALRPLIIDEDNFVIGGNMRLKALADLGYTELKDEWVKRAGDLTEDEKKQFIITDNSSFGQYDWNAIANEWDHLPLTDWGVDIPEDWITEPEALEEDDQDVSDAISKADELKEKWGTAENQLWQLGENHRILCGDSTKQEDVERLMDGEKAELIHADPPYGMGKEKDGVANDNLYREKLDAFQMEWWKTFRPFLVDNASAYIWGNAEDLWRLWYADLKKSERLTFRNQIVWNKQHGQGMSSDQHRMFPTATEHCLFFMLGEQGFNNNADNYWEGFESIRSWLHSQAELMGWNANDIQKICGVGMYSHWFTKSQWTFIPQEHYVKLQTEAKNDAFKKDYDELKKDFYATRAYFDNTHDNMTDVWDFERVQGADRWEHAMPKPVKMVERIIQSSCPTNGITVEPFLGSGTTLIACQTLNRKCFGMEISPAYTGVCLERYFNLTGIEPKLIK